MRSNTGLGMAPTLCSRCGDAVDEGCDPKDELAELNTLLKRLKLKRYDLKRKINRFHSPIIHHLPPDVTSTIFEFCLPKFSDHQLLKENLSIPLLLGAICSYWRDIAWSTPSLWSSMVLHVSSRHESHIIPGIAKEWLSRSGHLPLSIRIFSISKNKTLSRLADIINQYSTRWSDLVLNIPDFYYQRFHASDNHAPILKSIQFRITAFDSELMDLNFQLTCPRLERACLSFFTMDGTNIQWDNLTHLTLYFMSYIDSFIILRKTPRLVFCEISGGCPGYGVQGIVGGIEAVVLTSLRSLRIRVTTSADGYLNNIVAPHLEEFSVPKYYNPPMEVITSFFRRSACPLRSFSMAFRSFSPHFERFMNSFQSMNTLSIISIMETASYSKNTAPEDYDPRNILQLVAKVLSSQSTSLQQGFLPNLKILEYTGMLRVPSGNLDALYALPPADNAVRGPLHLFKLNLHPITRIPKKMMSYFSSLEERGVTVNVLSKSKDILQSSIDYYRRREVSLYRDWADNLDSSLFS